MSNQFESYTYCHPKEVRNIAQDEEYTDCDKGISQKKKDFITNTIKTRCKDKNECKIKISNII